MIIKKKLIITRDNMALDISDGDNFNAVFSINSVGGTLTFDLPYIEEYKQLDTKADIFTADRLRKFDFVDLYYAEIETNREVKDTEWTPIFRGYIESVNLNKTKRSHSYKITCNSMLGLASYSSSYTGYPGEAISLMPFKILQRANLQAGKWMDNTNIQPRDWIPVEYMDVQIDKTYGNLNSGNIKAKNCKEAIDEFRKKFGLIFTENMDGIVQVTTLTNYLYEVDKYQFKFVYPSEVKPADRRLTTMDFEKMMRNIAGDDNWDVRDFTPADMQAKKAKVFESVIKATSVLEFINKVAMVFNPITYGLAVINKQWVKDIFDASNKYSLNTILINYLTSLHKLDIYKDMQPLIAPNKIRQINNVLMFDTNENIFNITYPDVSSEYDGVIAYGYNETGKAIDITSIALKNIQPNEKGEYNLNMYKLYRRDINDPTALRKIARQQLYKIKQENKVSFQTIFLPYYRIGMPFVINDHDRYIGEELFLCTKITYNLSKDVMTCKLEGMSSVLNNIDEKIVTDRIIVADTLTMGIEDKIENNYWVNSWQ